MHFRVTVADKETGKESTILVNCDSEDAARAFANRAGYYVSQCEPTSDAHTNGEPSPQPTNDEHDMVISTPGAKRNIALNINPERMTVTPQKARNSVRERRATKDASGAAVVGCLAVMLMICLTCAGVWSSSARQSQPSSPPTNRNISAEDRLLANEPIPDTTRMIAESRGLDPRAFYIMSKKMHLNVETQKLEADIIRNGLDQEAGAKSDYSKR